MYKKIVGPSAKIDEITLVYLGQVKLHLSGTGVFRISYSHDWHWKANLCIASEAEVSAAVQ